MSIEDEIIDPAPSIPLGYVLKFLDTQEYSMRDSICKRTKDKNQAQIFVTLNSAKMRFISHMIELNIRNRWFDYDKRHWVYPVLLYNRTDLNDPINDYSNMKIIPVYMGEE